jgi:hypothetical protein
MLERLAYNIFIFKNGAEVINLRRELRWAMSLRSQRNRFLSADEVADMDEFYRKVERYTSLIDGFNSIMHRGAVTFNNDEEAFEALSELESARTKAEQNILEETEEDSAT